MNIRAFQLPQDIDLMNCLVRDGFQYPENPEWSIREDEMQGLMDNVSSAKRLWPLIRILRIFVPLFRDILCGFIAEEHGQPVGLINFMRQRNEPEWEIGNVTVLPSHRRRGIARKLVETTLAELKERKARKAFLEVVSGNDPAFHLYKEMGFDAFASSTQYQYQKDIPIAPLPLPGGYTLRRLSRFDWQTRFAFAQRVTPEHITHYQPVTEERFRTPLIVPLIGSLFESLGGTHTERLALLSSEAEVVGVGRYSYRTRPGGINDITVSIDPKHAVLAEYVLRYLISSLQAASPGHRIEFTLEDWETDLVQAAEPLGCEKRFGAHRMGLCF